MMDAKASADIGACQAKLTPEQSDKMKKAMMEAMGMGGGPPAGGGSDNAAPPAGGGSADGSAAAGGGGAAPAAGGGDLPAECGEYKAMIDKLASCDKMPQASRDALKQSYDSTSAAWASVPAEGKAALSTACKAAADATKQAAGQLCGW
jgi:hypothetical protein